MHDLVGVAVARKVVGRQWISRFPLLALPLENDQAAKLG